ncbi:hypothetical protein CHL76_16540 [Marinococcus halophilus]|uniref:Uncharacterized protein n=2 Tax=Marinococcus halophilus TaxID=1371 RepID=P71521_MARHA|nr:unknown [Marinococcus halophilus]OZT78712.1 hypothetical protein CHL76_16540 [Marinococcus halophilus]GEK60353.1 hypothetical protein MHA01_32580 [Marinococcus halophilus]
MILKKIAYIINWIIILCGYILLIPLVLPNNMNGGFWVYEYEFFGTLYISFFAFIFGLFGLILALALQIKHLIIVSLILFILPFFAATFVLLFY